jgi:cytochrome c-type protein NapC
MLKQGLARTVCIGLAAVMSAAIAFVLLDATFEYTNRLTFCTSCHSMDINYQEYQQTPHYKNASGVQTTCADCHVPKDFLAKFKAKAIALKEVYHEVAGTIGSEEKFEARRWELANLVWSRMRANDSRECRGCHNYNSMDWEAQDYRTRNKHKNADAKGKTCIDCHSGIVHEEPLEPDGLTLSLNPGKNRDD